MGTNLAGHARRHLICPVGQLQRERETQDIVVVGNVVPGIVTPDKREKIF